MASLRDIAKNIFKRVDDSTDLDERFGQALRNTRNNIRTEVLKPRQADPRVVQGLKTADYLSTQFNKGTPFAQPIAKKLGYQPNITGYKPTSTTGRVAGFVAEQAPTFALSAGIGNAIKGTRAVSGITKPIASRGAKLASPLLNSGKGSRLAGKALTGYSQSIPFQLGYNATSALNRNWDALSLKSQLGDAAFDMAVSALPGGAMIAGATTPTTNKAAIRTIRREVDDVLGTVRKEEKMTVKELLDMVRAGKARYDFKSGLVKAPDGAGNLVNIGRIKRSEAKYALGGVAGVEMYQDEDGTWKTRFSPTKAAIGTGLMMGGTKALDSIDSGLKNSARNGDGLIQNARKQIGEATDKKTSLKEGFDSFYTDWVNRFYPIEKLEAGVEKSLNVKVRPEFSPTVATKRLLGAGGVAEFRHKNTLQPIIEQLGDTPKGDFDIFLKAKRDIELGERDIIGSSPEQARQVIGALGQKYDINKLNEVAEQLYSYQRKNLDMLKEAGLLSEDAVSQIMAKNQKYVPFERVMDEVDNYLGLPTKTTQQGSAVIKGIKGSNRAILSPLESIVANTYKVESAISKNRVAQSIVSLRNIDPTLQQAITPSKTADGAITVWENGVKKYYNVPQDIVDAVKGLNEENMGVVLQILSAPARLLRQQATGRNIDFMLPNVFRDQFDAAINSKYGYKPFLDYFEGLRHLINYRKTGSDNIVEEWMQSGGKIFFENMGGRKDIKKQISDATEQKRFSKRLYDWAIGGIDTIGTYSEQPTRIGLYKRAKGATNNPLLAGVESREGTLDFARMGAKMKVANSLVPFLNVSVQGFDKTLRVAKEDPKGMALKLAVYGGIPATMASLYNNLYHGEEYARIPDFEKESNLIIVTGTNDEGDPTYLKYPKGHVTQLVMNPIDNFVTYLAGNNPQSLSQLALSMFSSTVPVIGEGNTPEEVYRRTIGQNMPQAFKPFAEDISNYNFYMGREIVPSYMKDRPAHEQYFKSTPTIYKTLGAATNTSPLRIKNFAEGTLAGGATQPVNLMEVLSGRGNINKVPVARRFSGSYADFDNERPEKQEGTQAGFMDRLLKSQTRPAEASETTQIPTNKVDFEYLYDKNNKIISRAGTKTRDIKFGDYTEAEKKQKMDEFGAEVASATKQLKEMEANSPEMVFDVSLDIYQSGAGRSVEERGEWAVKQLKAADEKQAQEIINKLWDAKVLTTGKSGVAQYIKDAFGIDVYNYTGNNSKIKSALGGSKKAKKGPSISIKKAKPISSKLFTSSSKRTQLPKLSIPKAPTAQLKTSSVKPKLSLKAKKYAPVKVKGFRNDLTAGLNGSRI